jgi:hypothetical protein
VDFGDIIDFIKDKLKMKNMRKRDDISFGKMLESKIERLESKIDELLRNTKSAESSSSMQE